jgi:hypothetical protein
LLDAAGGGAVVARGLPKWETAESKNRDAAGKTV